MARWTAEFRAFWMDEAGQDLIEYALIGALVALGTIAAMSSLANNIANTFSGMGSQMDSAIPSS